MTWFWLTIIYLIFLVSAEIINKKSLNNVAIDELIFGACVQLATAFFGLLFSLIIGWDFHFDLHAIVLYLGMTVAYFFAVSFYFTGLKKVDISLASILGSSGSIFSLILGTFFLSENMSWSKLVGIALIITANALLFWKSQTISLTKYALIIVGSSFFYALGAVFDKQLNTYGNAISYLTLSFTAAGLSMLIIYSKRTIKAFSGTFRNKAFWSGIAANGLLYSLGFWALFTAYEKGGEVSRMFPITLSAAIIIPMIGIILLGERTAVVRKLSASVIVCLGLWALGH